MLFKTNTIVGHRGCSLVNQNNTIEAFEKAASLGAEMVELDVRKTRDDVLVVIHDREIGGMRIRGNLYQDLAAAANVEGKVLPTLEEVLQRLEGRLQLDIELKEAGYEEDVLRLVLQYFSPSEFVISSFMDQVLLKIKKRFPTVHTGLIVGVGPHNQDFKAKGFRRIVQKLSEYFPWGRAKACGADFLAVSKHLLSLGMINAAAKRNVPLLVWNVNEPEELKKLMLTYKVAMIGTDRPDIAFEIRKDL
jgi:glycerophosphoryl diester phosphodiesterase